MVKARPFFPKWQGIQGFDLSLGTEAAFPSCGENDLWVLVRWFLTFEGLVASQVLETVWRALVAKDAACWELLRCKSRFRNCVAGLVQRKAQQMRLSKHRTTSHHLTLRTSPPEMTNQFRFAKYYDWWTDTVITVIWVNPNRCFIYSSFDAPLFTPKKRGSVWQLHKVLARRCPKGHHICPSKRISSTSSCSKSGRWRLCQPLEPNDSPGYPG